MTRKDKELLLKDLCARFPYKVVCKLSADGTEITEQLQLGGLGQFLYGRIDVKPYLRPMESMTEEEREEYELLANHCITTTVGFVHLEAQELVDWLNKNHFDYRGLIEKGLALEAPKDMYNLNTKQS